MVHGKVKWWNTEKGFGFLSIDGGKDVFVHYTAIQMPGRRDLEEGDHVEFEVAQSEKGPRAEKVVKIMEGL